MLFINPMWDNEAERIGKQRCTPLGYALHLFSDLIGLMALLLLFIVIISLGYCGIIGKFEMRMLWFLTIPFGLALVGSVLYRFSWMLAARRGFHYDASSREASWLEGGERQTYKYK